jgi:hypothetical protein
MKEKLYYVVEKVEQKNCTFIPTKKELETLFNTEKTKIYYSTFQDKEKAIQYAKNEFPIYAIDLFNFKKGEINGNE